MCQSSSLFFALCTLFLAMLGNAYHLRDTAEQWNNTQLYAFENRAYFILDAASSDLVDYAGSTRYLMAVSSRSPGPIVDFYAPVKYGWSCNTSMSSSTARFVRWQRYANLSEGQIHSPYFGFGTVGNSGLVEGLLPNDNCVKQVWRSPFMFTAALEEGISLTVAFRVGINLEPNETKTMVVAAIQEGELVDTCALAIMVEASTSMLAFRFTEICAGGPPTIKNSDILYFKPELEIPSISRLFVCTMRRWTGWQTTTRGKIVCDGHDSDPVVIRQYSSMTNNQPQVSVGGPTSTFEMFGADLYFDGIIHYVLLSGGAQEQSNKPKMVRLNQLLCVRIENDATRCGFNSTSEFEAEYGIQLDEWFEESSTTLLSAMTTSTNALTAQVSETTTGSSSMAATTTSVGPAPIDPSTTTTDTPLSMVEYVLLPVGASLVIVFLLAILLAVFLLRRARQRKRPDNQRESEAAVPDGDASVLMSTVLARDTGTLPSTLAAPAHSAEYDVVQLNAPAHHYDAPQSVLADNDAHHYDAPHVSFGDDDRQSKSVYDVVTSTSKAQDEYGQVPSNQYDAVPMQRNEVSEYGDVQ